MRSHRKPAPKRAASPSPNSTQPAKKVRKDPLPSSRKPHAMGGAATPPDESSVPAATNPARRSSRKTVCRTEEEEQAALEAEGVVEVEREPPMRSPSRTSNGSRGNEDGNAEDESGTESPEEDADAELGMYMMLKSENGPLLSLVYDFRAAVAEVDISNIRFLQPTARHRIQREWTAHARLYVCSEGVQEADRKIS